MTTPARDKAFMANWLDCELDNCATYIAVLDKNLQTVDLLNLSPTAVIYISALASKIQTSMEHAFNLANTLDMLDMCRDDVRRVADYITVELKSRTQAADGIALDIAQGNILGDSDELIAQVYEALAIARDSLERMRELINENG